MFISQSTTFTLGAIGHADPMSIKITFSLSNDGAEIVVQEHGRKLLTMPLNDSDFQEMVETLVKMLRTVNGDE